MFRMAIATVALIGMLTGTAPSFAADLLGDERYYDRSYYDQPYQPQRVVPAPRAEVYGQSAPVPPAYAPPESGWSCERPPYGTGDLRPLAEPYRWAPPVRQPSYWQPDYERPYGPPSGEWGGRIPIPQEGIYDRAPTAPDTYARPDDRRPYDLYANCGVNRYWDGQRCVDVRYAPYYPGSPALMHPQQAEPRMLFR